MDKKKEILKILKKGKLSTSRIAYSISSNQYKTEKLLKELKEENKIDMIQEKKGVYWFIK